MIGLSFFTTRSPQLSPLPLKVTPSSALVVRSWDRFATITCNKQSWLCQDEMFASYEAASPSSRFVRIVHRTSMPYSSRVEAVSCPGVAHAAAGLRNSAARSQSAAALWGTLVDVVAIANGETMLRAVSYERRKSWTSCRRTMMIHRMMMTEVSRTTIGTSDSLRGPPTIRFRSIDGTYDTFLLFASTSTLTCQVSRASYGDSSSEDSGNSLTSARCLGRVPSGETKKKFHSIPTHFHPFLVRAFAQALCG